MGEVARGPENQFSFGATHTVEQARLAIEAGNDSGQMAIGGRLMSKRDQGGIAFCDLRDETGSIQVVATAGKTPDVEEFVRNVTGNWVGVKGKPGATKRGEPSVFIEDWVTLARTEEPLPAKHGLKNPESILRQRYLDLAVNPASMQRFKTRSRIISLVRRALEDQDFNEVETPILQPVYGGAVARPFETHLNALDMDVYMRIAPELYLKQLVVGGMQRVFEIGKVFRNEGISTSHSPEFTTLEAYAAFWDYEQQMELTENLVSGVAQALHGTQVVERQGRAVDLTPPWDRIPMDRLVSEKIGTPASLEIGREGLAELCYEHGVNVHASYGAGQLLLKLYEKTVEPDLWEPIFVTDFPEEVAPLARSHRSRPGYAERFEGIVAGSELCNGFSELNDPYEQYLRFEAQETAGLRGHEAMPMDHDYIRALKHGLPPTAGVGIGVDRLVMLMTDASTIRDVITFPILKPDGYEASYASPGPVPPLVRDFDTIT